MPSGRRGQVPHGITVLEAARQLGVEIESICGGRQTCQKCRVRVENGRFDKAGIHSSEDHLSPRDEKEIKLLNKLGTPELRLSCNARILGDVLITVPEESRAHKQIIRKSAGERAIEVEPVVRQVYVEVAEARLGEHRGDWGRLQDALAEQWGLSGLSIDIHALRRLQPALRDGKQAVTVTLWQEQHVLDIRPGYQEGAFGLAVDVGSTTLAAYLCDLRTGELLASASAMNPQVSYGEDLMSRISFVTSRRDGLDVLHKAVIEALNRLAAETARQAGIRRDQIYEAVLVGNTTMTHILLGISPESLGGAPFALAHREAMDVKARDLGLRLHPAANVHILPSEAGHVGADNVAVLLAEQPHTRPEIILTVDVGTNAEIVLSGPGWMFSASSPTGPAFEGGQISAGMRAAPGAIERVRIDPQTGLARFRVIGEERWSNEWAVGADVPPERQPRHLASGICGSGIIEVVAELLLAGLLLPDGRFNPDSTSPALRWDARRRKADYLLAPAELSANGKPLLVTQEDIRNIQLAKAALYAGAKLLMLRAGVASVDRILLAGAFGSYIDPTHALVLGLIPDCSLERIHAVGNAAGDGARIALLNRSQRAAASQIARSVRYIETAVDPDFQEQFVLAMHLPHKRDPFPHLEGILPDLSAAPPRRRQTRRNKARGITQ
ncbi:MAG: DUF4445 domain-containing protein [Anaerolineae bacterium]|nr:MAG: DUF4445 domain-containing protein [Anaerolineae bacterium]